MIAVFAIRQQQVANRRAVEAQAEAAREERRHDRQMAVEQRIWDRRADLYSRIAHAMRDHLERPVDEAGAVIALGDVPLMAGLVSEADMLASPEASDLVNQFVYDDPEDERKVEIWGHFKFVTRRELGVEAASAHPLASNEAEELGGRG